jgi:hypothetical protein
MPITLASMSISGPPELASPSVRGMSTANERAVGQRTEYRCQQRTGSCRRTVRRRRSLWMIFRSDESARLPTKHSSLVPSHEPYSVPPLVDHCLADRAKAADN